MSNDLKQWQWAHEDPIENLLPDPDHQDAASLPEPPPSEPGEPLAPFDLEACLEELKRWQAVVDSSPANVSRRNHLEECQWVDEDPFARPARAPHKTNGAHLPAVAAPRRGLAKGPMGFAAISDPRSNSFEFFNQLKTLRSACNGLSKGSFSGSIKAVQYYFFTLFSSNGENLMSAPKGWERLLQQAVKRRRSRAS
jgi:hypothetical protein